MCFFVVLYNLYLFLRNLRIMLKINLEESWKKKLEKEFNQKYMICLKNFLDKEIVDKTIFPPVDKIFNAFNLTKFKDVKVVILGQDPYHGFGQANGLSFSVEKKIKQPPTLVNIFKELKSDLGIESPKDGNLEKWSQQGVLLLNSILTVEKGKPRSHENQGWETFTENILIILSELEKNLVFILWGKKAQQKTKFINSRSNLIIASSHPSPFSAHKGFFGSKPFSKTNDYLKKNSIEQIKWNLNN